MISTENLNYKNTEFNLKNLYYNTFSQRYESGI